MVNDAGNYLSSVDTSTGQATRIGNETNYGINRWLMKS